VTEVSVVSANGFAGTVADDTTTPAITLTTTVTGIVKGNGTALSAAVANTDYQSPITLTTTGSSGAATFDGTTLNIPQYTGGGGGQVDEVLGTSNRITVDATDPAAPIVDIASTYVGQNSITTLGTITTGVWNGTDIALADGGTGASLSDPGGDRILFWDDSAGVVTWLTAGSGLTITDTTLTASGGSGGTLNDAYDFGGAGAGRSITADTGAVEITVPDNSDNAGLVINQNDVTNSPNGLIVNSVVGASAVTSSQHPLLLKSTSAANVGPFLGFFHDSPSPSAADQIGGFGAFGNNAAAEETNYGGFGVTIADTTDGSEDAFMNFYVMQAGASVAVLRAGYSEKNGIAVGSGSAAGIVESYSNQDLILQTGNATTGTLTITDGADGAITIAPNGAGDVIINTTGELRPNSNDGTALGVSGTAWSDLFLASGAVINFDAGNSVITHSSGILTVSTGDLRVTTAGTNTASVVTVGGTQTLTAKTLTSPTINTASLGGTQLLAEGASIGLDPAGSADGAYSGITMTATSGYSQAFGDLVYLSSSDSRWEAVDADAASTSDRLIAMVVVAGTDGNACTLLLQGTIRADAKFPALTIGSAVYAGETAGAIQVAIPTGADCVIRRVGYALTADSIYFNPSMDSQIAVA
jgi:hypothetical protein